jgi:hypothetical protein
MPAVRCAGAAYSENVDADEKKQETRRYSFRKAHEEDAFHQADLLTTDAFGREAKERDFGLSFGTTLRKQLEELDGVGALRPIAFETESGELVFREEVGFSPWDTYAAVVRDNYKKVTAYYSHWQLVYTRDAVELGRVSVPISTVLDDDRRKNIGEGFRTFYEHQVQRWRALDDDWRDCILLLVRLQNRYFPVIRGSLTKINTRLGYDPVVGGYVDPYPQTVREFEPAAVLDELGLGVENVKEMHDRLAFQGIARDPLKYFHGLFRMAPYRERAKLKNEARRAQDAFDAAEMLRRFYHDLTGELLPAPDEMIDASGGKWKEQFYGHGSRLEYDRHDLQVALRLHHLDPHIVHLIVEGKSDEALFRGLIEALTGAEVSNLGIGFSNLEGVGRTRLYGRILRLAKNSTRFPVLVADREGDIERDVELLKAEGLLSDETAFLWNASLEEDNFTHEELVASATQIAERKGGHLQLEAEQLRAARESQEERLGEDAQGLAELLLGLARNPQNGAVRISKPELAQELVQVLLDEIEREEDQEALVQRRPVLGIVFSIIRIA